MATLARTVGWSNGIVRFGLANTSTGGPLTGLTRTESSLKIAVIKDIEAAPVVYTAAASKIEDIATLGTYVAPSASDRIRFKEIDSSNLPGDYELQLLNTRFDTNGVGYVDICVQATGFNCLAQTFRIDLDAQVDVRQNAGVGINSSGGRQQVDVWGLLGDTSRVQKLGIEMDGRTIGTVETSGFAGSNVAFECADITDSTSASIYQNRGFLISSGAIVKAIGIILSDSVGVAGRRFNVAQIVGTLADGDKILIL